MYAIDFLTCSADDVIRRSATCHPSMLVEALRRRADTHASAAATMMLRDKYAGGIALKMADECQRVADRVERGDDSCVSFGERISAFSAAAHLQCLSPALAQDIINRAA